MIIYFDKNTGEITRVIQVGLLDIPLPKALENEEILKIEYENKKLLNSNPTITEKFFKKIFSLKSNIFLYKFVLDNNLPIDIVKKEIKQSISCVRLYPATIIVDIQKFIPNKNIRYCQNHTLRNGLWVQIYREDTKYYFFVFNKKGILLSEQRFHISDDEKLLYTDAVLFKRESYPHYLGMVEAIKEFKKLKFKYLDLMYLTGDRGIDRFKKQWGDIVEVNSL